jgi:hypothetical protein
VGTVLRRRPRFAARGHDGVPDARVPRYSERVRVARHRLPLLTAALPAGYFHWERTVRVDVFCIRTGGRPGVRRDRNHKMSRL